MDSAASDIYATFSELCEGAETEKIRSLVDEKDQTAYFGSVDERPKEEEKLQESELHPPGFTEEPDFNSLVAKFEQHQ